MTRPWRRMILHLLQIFLTLGLTFTANFSSFGGVGVLPHTIQNGWAVAEDHRTAFCIVRVDGPVSSGH